MLHTLKIDKSFSHSNATFNFQKGLTAISGLNGTGKSEILEIIQWLLFGTKALRGEVDHQAQLTFEVKGETYTVSRSKNKALLKKGEAPFASGTKPVNQAIVSLLGYGYEVFTVANAVNQGKITELGEMLPAERKRLVDQTIGLDKIEEISKWVTGKLAEVTAMARVHEKYNVAPAPVGPDPAPNCTLDALQSRTEQARAQAVLRQELMKIAPLPLVKLDPDWQKIEELQEAQERRRAGLGALQALSKALHSLPDAGPFVGLHERDNEYEPLKLEAEKYKRKTELEDLIKKLPVSPYSEKYLKKEEDQHALFLKFLKREELLKHLVEYKCPKCLHKWHDEDPRLKDYLDVPDVVADSALTSNQINTYRRMLAQSETRKILEEELSSVRDATNCGWVVKQIATQRLLHAEYQFRLAKQSQKEDLQKQYDSLSLILPPDGQDEIVRLKANLKEYEKYAYSVIAAKDAAVKLNDIPGNISEYVEECQKLWNLKLVHSVELKAYLSAKEVYEKNRKEAEKVEGEIEDWKKVREALNEMKVQVKTHLIPSLNKVSSQLLSMFSSGWLNKVDISEEFEIQIDGKKISALSGAGKAFANLAIRIGLGLVLTNGVFSVLMLDEIDAGVDLEKAPTLAEALRGLTGQIKQIINVSHKQNLVSDYAINL